MSNNHTFYDAGKSLFGAVVLIVAVLWLIGWAVNTW